MKSQSSKTFFAVLISLMLILVNPMTAAAGPVQMGSVQEEGNPVEDAFAYLQTQMNPDGGVVWMDENSAVAPTIKVVQALAANGLTQDALLSAEGNRPIDFLASAGEAWVNQEETENPAFSVARAGQLLAALAAANEDPHNFGADSIDLVYQVQAQYDSSTGAYGRAAPENVTDQVWALIGLAANNASIPVEAADWLAAAQLEDGSWDDGYGSYLDTTPLGILALVSSEQRTADSPDIASALDFIAASQQPSGGWQTEWDTTTNADTTAVILQAIYAIGQTPTADNWQTKEGNPATALAALQKEDGSIGGDFANAYSTADALIGLAGQPITNLGDLSQADNAFDFLFSAQDASGGWESVGQTLDVILALEAAGWQPETVQTEGVSPLDYIAANLDPYLEAGPDSIGKAILGVVASDEDPASFNGVDLTGQLLGTYDDAAQAFGDPENTWHQALAILGLSAAGAEIPEGAVASLAGLQQEDGGWEYTPGFGTWPDNTALAMQALLAAGYDSSDPVMSKAIAYLQATQMADGGWGDSSTTAYALMALNALGESEEDWGTDAGVTPLTNLMTYQKANGSFVYNWEFTDDSVMSTASALLALFGEDYLVQPSEPGAANQAAIIIDPGEGDPQSACVEFTDESISGLDLLEASGFDYDAPDGFVSAILGLTNPEGETNYWSYWVWDGSGWVFKETGASGSEVLPGAIEAWHFTSWEQFPSLPPDVIPEMTAICGQAGLKDYRAQPNLGYFDLYPAVSTQPIPSEPTAAPTASEATQDAAATAAAAATSTSVPTAVENESETLPLLPLLVIGILGVGLVVVIVLMVTGKKE